MKCPKCGAPLERASPHMADIIAGPIRTHCVFYPCDYCCDDETSNLRSAIYEIRHKEFIKLSGYQPLYSMNGRRK